MVKMARMMHLVGLLLGLCLPGLALAQEIADARGKAALPAASAADAAPAAEPRALLRVLRRAPDGTLAWLQGLILAYGEAGADGQAGLSPQGMLSHIAVLRARVRAREAQRFLAADLDNDGSVSVQELALASRALSAAVAGRLMVRAALAESDGRPGLSPGEIAAYAAAQGEEAIPARERAVLEEMLLIDANRDGLLSMTEMRAALARLRPG